MLKKGAPQILGESLWLEFVHEISYTSRNKFNVSPMNENYLYVFKQISVGDLTWQGCMIAFTTLVLSLFQINITQTKHIQWQLLAMERPGDSDDEFLLDLLTCHRPVASL